MSSALRTAAPAAPRIVLWPQATNFDVEDRTVAYTSDEHTHAVLAGDITARLRTVLLRHVNERLRRRARQIAFLRHVRGNARSRRWISATAGFDENSTDVATVCPSATATRWQCALTRAFSGTA